ncbi:4470_t:CDS:2 [Acaulospora colombiana]|uniref:4470_t:CDS:1 n=1 Tax=Acaulospora colombiana TaxID=27376 RepID=A0ACA9MHQ0_9GLOM|nr:4470_t:CDS:2 [Acaulospora colombiana]
MVNENDKFVEQMQIKLSTFALKYFAEIVLNEGSEDFFPYIERGSSTQVDKVQRT